MLPQIDTHLKDGDGKFPVPQGLADSTDRDVLLGRSSTNSSVEELRQIEKVCDSFEQAWQSDEAPRIEDYLARGPANGHNRLFHSLLEMELDYRADRGESPTTAEYRARFPHCEQVVNDVFAECSSGDQTAPFAGVSQPQRLGEYELRSVLGQGGMGVVYLGFHTRLKRMAAIKLLRQEQFGDAGAVARFAREVAAIGQLSHPNIVVAHDAGEVSGAHFLVMEFVDGIDLATLLDRHGPLPIAETCEIVRQTATALQYAHEQGLVHRDIKPSNLMLTREGTIKLLDLGLARLKSAAGEDVSELTQTGQIMGTFDYMAPEQVENCQHADIRADIYSLGATFYKLLVGRPPLDFADAPLSKRLMAILTETPVLIDQLRAELPEEVREIVHRCLEKCPSDRFQLPGELAAALVGPATGSDLVGLWGDAPIDKRPEILLQPSGGSTPRTQAKRPRQRRTIMASSAAVLLAAAGAWMFLPHTDSPSKTPTDLLLSVERGERLYGKDEFIRALPVRAGDELQIVADLPANLHTSAWAFDSDGALHEFSGGVLQATATGTSFVFPAQGAKLPVDDRTGTELVIIVGLATESAADDATLRNTFEEVLGKNPLPAGLPHNVVVMANRDMVMTRTATGETPRGFGEPQQNALARIETKLDQLRLRLREKAAYLAVVAFPHEP